MLRILLIGFLIAYGLVHVAIWTPKHDPEKAPVDASQQPRPLQSACLRVSVGDLFERSQ